jgi:hypothetical protein
MSKRDRKEYEKDNNRDKNDDDAIMSSDDDLSSFSDKDRKPKKEKKKRKESKKTTHKSHRKHHHHKHRKKEKKRRDYSDDDDDDDDNSESTRSRKRRKKDKKHRKRRDDDDDDVKSDDDSNRHRRKKDKKSDSKKRRRKDRQEDKSSNYNNNDSVPNPQKFLERNHVVAQALDQLLADRPVFAQELPLLLIRLAGGATFELRQMTDGVAARGLQRVLESLHEFGVQPHPESGMWMFQAPPGRRDELVLLRVIRSLLDDIGITMEAVEGYETTQQQQKEEEEATPQLKESKDIRQEDDEEMDHIKEQTSEVVLEFQTQDANLGQQLAELCKTIALGESISIDGLPDEKLKQALESIFVQCGLEKSEMADDDSDDDDDEEEENEPLMGYGLPASSDNDRVQLKLAAVMAACRNPTPKQAKRRIMGPARGPIAGEEHIAAAASSSEDDEGPAPVGMARRKVRGADVLSPELIKAQAAHRALEFNATVAGVSMPTAEGEREEWMLVPGKFDFMSHIKSGDTMKSRGFENKKAKEQEQAPIHPAIQAEMDAIMELHQNARGPSLFEQHRAKKQQEKQEKVAAIADGKSSFEWKRDKDLDEGRRVDKDALHMVLGGAANNLKTKFQGGF